MKICSERLHLQLGYMLFLTHYFIEKGENTGKYLILFPKMSLQCYVRSFEFVWFMFQNAEWCQVTTRPKTKVSVSSFSFSPLQTFQQLDSLLDNSWYFRCQLHKGFKKSAHGLMNWNS